MTKALHRYAASMEQIYERLGERLRALREKKGWSQRETAKAIGVDNSQLMYVEKGKRRMMLHDVARYAENLGTTPEKLLRGLWE